MKRIMQVDKGDVRFGSVPSTINVDCHVIYDSPQLLNWVFDTFECSSFNLFMLRWS